MPPELTNAPLFPFAVLFGVLGAVLVIAAIISFVQLRLPQSGYRMVAGLLLLALGSLAGTISVGMMGYRALTREDVAARIVVKPAGPQRFIATFRFADGREATYDLAGDEIYVDAHILKWHSYANMIGLHTAYELDRVAGRYHAIKDEREAMRTVHALSRGKPVDLYATAPAPRVPRAGVRRRVRLGDLRPGDASRRARAARLHHRSAHARSKAQETVNRDS